MGSDAIGTVIGGYRIESVLGVGGMSVVYRARHPRLPRSDALKVLSPSAIEQDPAARERFQREAARVAGLEHPNIVRIYDSGTDRGRLWLSMQLIPGTDALGLLREHPDGVPLSQTVDLIRAVADALDYSHSVGVQHRDVKPGNIFVDRSRATVRYALGDFGIARGDTDPKMTQAGSVLGTVDYCSPEHLAGGPRDGRTDQYSLAATAVHLLSGRRPYGTASVATIAHRHIAAPPPRPSELRPGLPRAVDAVIARAMAKDPQDRYPSCRSFAAAFAEAVLVPSSAARAQPGPASGDAPPRTGRPTGSRRRLRRPPVPEPGTGPTAATTVLATDGAAPRVLRRRGVRGLAAIATVAVVATVVAVALGSSGSTPQAEVDAVAGGPTATETASTGPSRTYPQAAPARPLVSGAGRDDGSGGAAPMDPVGAVDLEDGAAGQTPSPSDGDEVVDPLLEVGSAPEETTAGPADTAAGSTGVGHHDPDSEPAARPAAPPPRRSTDGRAAVSADRSVLRGADGGIDPCLVPAAVLARAGLGEPVRGTAPGAVVDCYARVLAAPDRTIEFVFYPLGTAGPEAHASWTAYHHAPTTETGWRAYRTSVIVSGGRYVYCNYGRMIPGAGLFEIYALSTAHDGVHAADSACALVPVIAAELSAEGAL